MDQWSKLPMPMKPSYAPAMVLKQHRLVAMGGNDHDNNRHPNDRIQEYDIARNQWSLVAKTMPLKLVHHYAFTVEVRK
jgi:hypothetical protein